MKWKGTRNINTEGIQDAVFLDAETDFDCSQ